MQRKAVALRSDLINKNVNETEYTFWKSAKNKSNVEKIAIKKDTIKEKSRADIFFKTFF